MKGKALTVLALVAAVALAGGWPLIGAALADDKLPSKSDQSCLKCHEYDKSSNLLAGKLVDVSSKANALQLQIDKDMEVIYFDDSIVLKNAPSLKEIPKQESIRITYLKKNGKNFAKEIEVKKGIAVPKEKLADADEVAKLVALGPEKGKYVLLDSRPGEAYAQGHIPTAISMPFFAFDKLQETVLPKDKEILQIYYCIGFSWVLSPLAARKAEKLGYKNVKVFHAGMPAWKKAGNIVVSNMAGIENYDKLGASYILLDLRPANVAEKGHLPKAVGLPASGLDALKDQFPKYLNAPVILYTQHGDTEAAKEAYKKISSWGYKQVSILTGGFDAWEKAGKTIAKGPAETKITYVRKLLPGEVDIEAFKALVRKPSADSVILDVRAVSEVAEGALPNTKTIPLDDLEQKLADLPKDKKIVIHCSTGARAEMAYNLLKKAGFNASYVKANVDFDKEKKGEYKITD